MGALGGSSPPRRILPTTVIPTRFGKFMDLRDPQPTDIEPSDMVGALARTGRFSNQTGLLYSVAQHSVLLSRAVSHAWKNTWNAQRWALMHDAHEAYMGDFTRPVVDMLETLNPGTKRAIQTVKENIDAAIITRFALDVNDDLRGFVHDFDLALCDHEIEWLFTKFANGPDQWVCVERGSDWARSLTYWDGKVWPAGKAADEFYAQMEALQLF